MAREIGWLPAGCGDKALGPILELSRIGKITGNSCCAIALFELQTGIANPTAD